MRDEAISHLLGKSEVLEKMIEGLAQSVDMYITFKEDRDDFLEFYNKEIGERNEQQAAEQEDGQPLEENQGDEGQRSEGIREEE
jgi:hypothetical protein